MKKFQILSIAALFSILTVFAGCGAAGPSGAPGMPGEEVIQEGLVNMYYDVQSYNYDMSLQGNVQAPEGEKPENLDFDLNINGLADSSDPTVPQFTMNVGLTGLMDEDSYAVDAEIRLDATNVYAILNSLSGVDELASPEMVESFMGQWWSMPIPPGTFDDVSFGSGVAEEDMTEEELAIKTLVKETKFFGDAKYLGEEEMGGASTSHYSATLDKNSIKKFLIDGAKIMGEPEPTESELLELDDILATLELSAEFYVGNADMIMRGMSGDFELLPKEGGSIKLNFNLEVSNFNEGVVIEIPEGATEFDPMMLFGGVPTYSDPANTPEKLPEFAVSDEVFADLKSDFDSLE